MQRQAGRTVDAAHREHECCSSAHEVQGSMLLQQPQERLRRGSGQGFWGSTGAGRAQCSSNMQVLTSQGDPEVCGQESKHHKLADRTGAGAQTDLCCPLTGPPPAQSVACALQGAPLAGLLGAGCSAPLGRAGAPPAPQQASMSDAWNHFVTSHCLSWLQAVQTDPPVSVL